MASELDPAGIRLDRISRACESQAVRAARSRLRLLPPGPPRAGAACCRLTLGLRSGRQSRRRLAARRADCRHGGTGASTISFRAPASTLPLFTHGGCAASRTPCFSLRFLQTLARPFQLFLRQSQSLPGNVCLEPCPIDCFRHRACAVGFVTRGHLAACFSHAWACEASQAQVSHKPAVVATMVGQSASASPLIVPCWSGIGRNPRSEACWRRLLRLSRFQCGRSIAVRPCARVF